MRLTFTAVALVGVLGGVAWAQPPLETAPVVENPAVALFNARCQGCHNDLVSNAPTLFTLQAYKPAVIVAAMKTGKMQRMAMGLSDEEISSIAKLITAKPAA